MDFSATVNRIEELKVLLRCDNCNVFGNDLFTVAGCDHNFCSECSDNVDNYCPMCKLPTCPKEKAPRYQLNKLIVQTKKMQPALDQFIQRAELERVKQCQDGPSRIDAADVFNASLDEIVVSNPKPLDQIGCLDVDDGLNNLDVSNRSEDDLDVLNFELFDKTVHNDELPSPSKSRQKQQIKKQLGGYRRTGSNFFVAGAKKFAFNAAGSSKGRGKKSPKLATVAKSPVVHFVPSISPVASVLTSTPSTSAKVSRSSRSTEHNNAVSNTSFMNVSFNVDKRNANGETLLHQACTKNNLSVFKDYIDLGAPVNVQDNNKWTPLHEACRLGNLEMIQILIDNGAWFHVPAGERGITPLHDAVSNDQPSAVEVLLKNGCPTDFRDFYGQTAEDLLGIDTSIMKSNNIRKLFLKYKNVEKKTTETDLIELVIPKANSVKCVISSVKHFDERLFDQLEYATLVKSVGEATHLLVKPVAENNKLARRSQKYFDAILAGIWILDVKWLQACSDQMEYLPELEYELAGCLANGANEAPKRSRINKSLMLPGLFKNCNFLFSGSFVQPVQPLQQLIKMVRDGEGVVIKSPLSKNSGLRPFHAEPGSPIYEYNTFVVFQPNGKNDERALSLENIDLGIKTVSVTWLLDCIACFQFAPFEN